MNLTGYLQHKHKDVCATNMELAEKFKEMEGLVKEWESKYDILKDSTSTKELQFQTSVQQLTTKMEGNINQITAKLKNAENDKNMAVIKYATREAETMKLTSTVNKLNEEVKALTVERDALKHGSSQQVVTEMAQIIESLKEELAKEKKDNQKISLEYGMAEKRIAASHTSIKELKSKMDMLMSQVNNVTEERDSVKSESRNLHSQIQVLEIKIKEIDYQHTEKLNSRDKLYRDIMEEMSRLRNENVSLNQSLNAYGSEGVQSQLEQELLQDKLSEMEDKNKEMSEELNRLRVLESEISNIKAGAKEAEQLKVEAFLEKEQAEVEAANCKNETERLLTINAKLTEQNSRVASEALNYKIDKLECAKKSNQMEIQINDLKTQLIQISKKLDNKDEANNPNKCSQIENGLKENLIELETKLKDCENEKAILKKKFASYQKEIRIETQKLRKQIEVYEKQSLSPMSAIDESSQNGKESFCPSATLSRTSSIQSFETASGYRLSSAPSTNSPNGEDRDSANNLDVFNAQSEKDINVQQAMIQKIVKLQKQLIKKKEKMEFLDEHVTQCTEELKRKTKIIQNYALREESAALKPMKESLEEILNLYPVTQTAYKSKETSLPLLGTWFTSKSNTKTNLQISTDVNARLQALVEDLLLKNMKHKEIIEQLEKKIADIEREKRQLYAAADT
uniref:GRIP domain-containing protein n=1 Tax=Rhabditophanes sp. KR3021 TaxID=114890 RepID=A0AC35U9Q6_9BILA